MSETAEDLTAWEGRTETTHGIIHPGDLDRMAATLDRDDQLFEVDAPVPPQWHWIGFRPDTRHSRIGADGHPERGGFMPPVDLPRRMFAGARYVYHAPLRAGQPIVRTSTISSVAEKEGKSGPLVFVTVHHEMSSGDSVCVEEEHDIVYRGETDGGARQDETPETIVWGPWRETVEPDPVILFRYSALTFNAHRIHYDRTYATEVEGYPGLVVHGPLIATYLSELCRNHTHDRPFARFGFRARRPLFDTAPFEVTGAFDKDGGSAWLKAVSADGHTAMDATVTFAG